MAEHEVTGTCLGVAAGMGACLRPCGQQGCSVTCCETHREQYAGTFG